MTVAILPQDSVLHTISNDGNSVTYALPGHTVAAPKLAIFKRRVPQYDTGRKTWSTPSYDYKVVAGVLDSDGNPVRPLVSVGTDGVTYPMVGDVGAVLASAKTLFNGINTAITAELIQAQYLPTPHDVVA